MKVVHISTGLDIGGAEIMLERLLTLHPEQRSHVTVISLQELGHIGARLESQGFRVIALKMTSKLAFLFTLRKLVVLLKSLKPDLVQTWMYHADLLGGVAAKIAKVPVVVWGVHCSKLPLGRPLTTVVMKACAWLSASVPDAIVAVAEEARKNHIAYGYAKDKFHVISNGFIPFEKFDQTSVMQLKDELGLGQVDWVLGSVGRYHPDKGQDILIQALSLLPRDIDWQCVLVGKGCEIENAELQRAIADHQLSERVRLLGLRDDVPHLLQCFDIFCLPSRTEAFPMALGEAMSVGLACVATDVGDCAELVGDSGFIVPPSSAKDLADGLYSALLLGKEQLKLVGDNACHRVLTRFDLRLVSQKYQQLYRDLTSVVKLP